LNGGTCYDVGPSIIQALWFPTISADVHLQSVAPNGKELFLYGTKSHLEAMASQ